MPVVNSPGELVNSIVFSIELKARSGIASNLQTQLSAKQATITGGVTAIATSKLTINRALLSDASGKVGVSTVTNTELGCVSCVTSAIQTQVDKCALGVPLYAGQIGSTGTVMRDNGYYTCTVTKSAPGIYVINLNASIATNQHAVSGLVRSSVAMFITYSSQTTSACTFYTFNSAGSTEDTQVSFSVRLK